jgi:hypothetical protein
VTKRKQPSTYEVGYGRPPKGTQFKKGQSGNPRGRPKDSKNLSSRIKAVMGRKVTIPENGRPRRVAWGDALLMKVVSKALAGDMSAARLAISLLQSVEEASPTSPIAVLDQPGNRALIQEFFEEFGDFEVPATGKSKAETKKAKAEEPT